MNFFTIPQPILPQPQNKNYNYENNIVLRDMFERIRRDFDDSVRAWPVSEDDVDIQKGMRKIMVETGSSDRTVQLPPYEKHIEESFLIMKTDSGTGNADVTPESGEPLNGITDGVWSITEQYGFIEITSITDIGWVVTNEHNSCILRYSSGVDWTENNATSGTWYPVTNAELNITAGKWRLGLGAQAMRANESTDPVENLYLLYGISTSNSGTPDIRWVGSTGIYLTADYGEMIQAVPIFYNIEYTATGNETLYWMACAVSEETPLTSLAVYSSTDSPTWIEAKRIA